MTLLCFSIGIVVGQRSTLAQSGVPQTNLVPIGPPSGNFARPGVPGNQFPSTTPPSFQTPNFQAPPNFNPPNFNPPAFNPPPPTAGGFGSFDPYASVQPGSPGGNFGAGVNITPIGPPTPISPGGGFTPGFNNPPSTGGLFGGLFSRPASGQLNAPIINSPPIGGPVFGGYDNANVYGQPVPGLPSNAFPSSSPTTLFPGGIMPGGSIFSGGNPSNQFSAYRLLQGPRLRHTFVGSGDDDDALNTNDTDVSLVFAFPNFLYSTQPLYVVPSFSLHLWDGPRSSTGADLPASAYSGFIDVGWNSDPNQIFSTELGVRVGAFTDFDTFNGDSIRVLGKALANFRLTPNSTLKGGVYYLDRNRIKLVPAGGLLYQPNPYTRLDLFFPQPKLAQYWRTIGTRDVWWYVAGDYGGGSWTINRDNGKGEDSVDINELRVLAGFEWGQSDAIRAGRRTGFFEVGYAFERELEYRRNPADDLDLDDGIIFRLGIGY
ncbi:hypothetical protein [Rubripirellula obstinata]|nr:hypothetical protein [Rubripirellula obstinata]